jgi:nicotinamidase/pyrazinamidase
MTAIAIIVGSTRPGRRADRVARVFVTPEYNHATSAVLKNAIDFLYLEWNNKSAGFVGYGAAGGTRAVEHLRLVMGELQVADVRAQLGLSLFADFTGDEFTPAKHQEQLAGSMLDQVVGWPTELPAGDPDGQTDLAAGLDVRGTIVPKGPGRSGGFSGFVLLSSGLPDGKAGGGGLSALPGLLRDAEVDSVVVAGIATDVCVSATARDARRLGYPVTIPLPATAFVHAHPDGDDAALAELREAGVTITE